MYNIGSSKIDITVFSEDCGMLGYGRHDQYLKGIETPQYARAFVFERGNKKVVFVIVDYCFTTVYLKHGIIQQLATFHPEMGYEDANVMIVAQHTHSTAGGYTQHLIYNMTVPGFQADVYKAYRDGIVKAIIEADQNLQAASIRLHRGEFDQEAPVAFNRSMSAYNKNPEIEQKLGHKNRHLAVNRNMDLLHFQAQDGQPIGCINWFGVHTTSVSGRRDKVCYDNKGYAADFFEEYLAEAYGKDSNINCGFAQASAGDISPNYIWNRKHREYRGKYEDDYESAAYNGQLQFEKARDIFEETLAKGTQVEGEIDYIQAYFDMTKISIHPEYTNGLGSQVTSDACFGMAFLQGTTDGQGMSNAVGSVLKTFINSGRELEILAARLSRNEDRQDNTLNYFNGHRPKAIVMNLSKGIVAGAKKPKRLAIPNFVDPIIKYIKHVHRVGQKVRTPWVPERLPLQIFIIGQLAIVGIPSEITTIAGQRLEKTLLEVLKQRGVNKIILSPYANAYAGYITTPEEYKVQRYEGGHTLFGRWTLPAYQIKFKSLANELLKHPEDRSDLGVQPIIFEEEEIWRGFKDPGVRVY